MKPHDLTATSFLTTRLVTWTMCALGLYFLLQPDALGWSALAELVGGETRLLGLGIFCAFVLVAALASEKNALRVRTAELMDGMHQLLYGKSYERDREAIDILLRALASDDPERKESAHKHLVRLTGQHFAPDARVWGAWWTANRRHFSSSAITDPPDDVTAEPPAAEADGRSAAGGETGGEAGA